MNHAFENEIWESILKAAVIENAANELKDYPSDEEMKQIVLPESYDRKMRRLIKRCRRRETLKSIFRYSRKIAAILLIFIGISFAFLLQHEEVRAACQKVLIEIYERYIRISYTGSRSPAEATPELGYIPDGFSMTEEQSFHGVTFLEYENTEGISISICYSTASATAYMDHEHYILSTVDIQGTDGLFWDSQDAQFENMLVWNTPDAYCKISSFLGKDELIKIAENLK